MGRKRQRDEKIIHVVFGPGGGRVQKKDDGALLPVAEAGAGAGREPLTDLFSSGEISRLLGISQARLRTFDRAGVVSQPGDAADVARTRFRI